MFDFDAMQKMLEGINRSMARQEFCLIVIMCLTALQIFVIWFDGRKLRKFFKNKEPDEPEEP